MWWLRRSGAANKTLLLPLPGDWLSWLERCLHTAEVTGSNPVSPTPRITHAEINGVDSFETSVMHGDREREFCRALVFGVLVVMVSYST